MSWRSVVLVTTLSCACAVEAPANGDVASTAPNATWMVSRWRNILVYSRAPVAPNASEWVRLVRAQSERGLQQNAIGCRALCGRVPLVPDHQLGEFAREELQVSRDRVRRAAAGAFVLKRIETGPDVAATRELISCEGVAAREVPGGSAIGQTIWRY